MIWGYVVTGIVGLAGIVGSILSARLAGKSANENLRLNINAEDKRADLAERRRIYAGLHTAMEIMRRMVGELSSLSSEDAEGELARRRQLELKASLRDAQATMLGALAEVKLIAPESVADMAEAAVFVLMVQGTNAERGDFVDLFDFFQKRNELYNPMRADLGKSTDLFPAVKSSTQP